MSKFVKLETIKQWRGQNLEVKNARIDNIDIEVIAHFGNTVSLVLDCDCGHSLHMYPLGLYSSIHNIGYIIRALVLLFDIEKEDGITLQEFKNTPLRLVLDDMKTIGIGNFIDDKFILIEDLLKVED